MLQKDAVYPPLPQPIGHVVLTRFNLRQYAQSRPAEDLSNYRRWLSQRTELFRQVCLPSLTHQKRLPDLWLIGMDAQHRGEMGEVLSSIAPYEWIQPAWQQPHHADHDVVTPFAPGIKAVSARHALVATTRVDNDDALAADYIADVDSYAKAVLADHTSLRDFWIAFTSGAQLSRGRFYHYIHSRPHFLTRVTRELPASDNVMAINHTQLYRDGRKVFTPTATMPMWLQNVHESNISNRRLPNLLEFADRARLQELFGIDTGDSSEL